MSPTPFDYQGYELSEHGSTYPLQPGPQAARPRGAIRQTFADFKNDFRSVSWGRDLLIFIWVSGLIAGFIVVGLSGYWDPTSACTPDGQFTLRPGDFSFWSSSSFFQITFGSGALTFTQAKAIDIVWDVVVGRGGQAIMALVTWQVFARYVTASMAIEPVTFTTFRTIFLHKEPTVVSFYHIIRDFITRRRLSSMIAMIFMVFSMAFILLFPTFASAMTGYSGNVQAYVPDENGNLVGFKSFQPILYVVHDGDRVNHTLDYAVTPKSASTLEPYMSDGGINGLYLFDSSSNSDEDVGAHDFALAVSEYVKEYGFFGLNNGGSRNVTSKFGNDTLDPPVLNISATYLPAGVNFFGWDWKDSRTNDYPLQNPLNITWEWSSQTFNHTYVTENGQCQPTKYYQWGFSFIQLFIVMALGLLWSFGTFIMWLKAHKILQNRGSQDVAGEYKAILELAAAINENLRPLPEENWKTPSNLNEMELRQRISEKHCGGSIAYQVPMLDAKSVKFRTLFKQWLVKEKWWILVCVPFLGLTSAGWMSYSTFYLWIWSFGPTVGLLFAMSVCSTFGSRLLLFLIFSTTTAIIVIGLMSSFGPIPGR